jgi:Zn finger protein HypA/HybF involved in hydrogenase expression
MLSLDQLLAGSAVPKSTPTASTAESCKTLEAYHQQELSKLRTQAESLPELHQQVSTIRGILAEEDRVSPFLMQLDLATLKRRQEREKELAAVQTKIARIESGEEEADYFLRVGDILFSYADARERIAKGEQTKDPIRKTRIPVNSVFAYFEKDQTAPVEEVPIVSTAKVSAGDIVTDIGFHRDKALEQYLSALHPESMQHESVVAASIEEHYGDCPVCETEMMFYQNEAILSCATCGHQDFILVDSEKPSYKDPPREMAYCAYKKVNHLNEWLAQFQAKETTEISNTVLDQIRAELRKERITDMSRVKASKIKEVIRKLKLVRCYDHVAHILNRLNGISAPALSREVEDKLRFMFKEIQFSFVKHCPPGRSNFLSYSFVLYKFCELLELDEYLPCFPLLKSREKLYLQDKIWQKICSDMGWQFNPTC